MTDITSDVGSAATFRLGTVFSKAFAIYGRHLVPLVLLTLIAHIPQYLAMWLLPPAGGPGVPAGVAGAAGSSGVGVLLGVVTTTLAAGVVMYGVVQDLSGRRFSLIDAVGVVVRRLLPMLGIAVCVGLAYVLGLILLIVPGVIVFCMYYVAVPACIVERTGVFASMSRSRSLTKGYRWQIFGTLILVGILAAVLVLGPVFLFSSTGHPGVALISQVVVGAIVGAFSGVVNGVFYYELRVAKEGVDIHKIASVFE